MLKEVPKDAVACEEEPDLFWLEEDYNPLANISLSLNNRVIEWFEASYGKDYLSEMNRILCRFVEEAKLRYNNVPELLLVENNITDSKQQTLVTVSLNKEVIFWFETTQGTDYLLKMNQVLVDYMSRS